MKDMKLPQGPFTTIVADPPWQYRDKLNMAVAADGTPQKAHRGAASHYNTMPLAEIAALPVDHIAAPDAHLYLWATNAFLEEAHGIARAWGFTPRTVLTWVKGRIENERFIAHIGMGSFFRNNTEHVLFCVRGKLPTLRANIPTAFFAPRTRHSEKPNALFDIVEASSPGPYLEMFARQPRDGWICWGDELE